MNGNERRRVEWVESSIKALFSQLTQKREWNISITCVHTYKILQRAYNFHSDGAWWNSRWQSSFLRKNPLKTIPHKWWETERNKHLLPKWLIHHYLLQIECDSEIGKLMHHLHVNMRRDGNEKSSSFLHFFFFNGKSFTLKDALRVILMLNFTHRALSNGFYLSAIRITTTTTPTTSNEMKEKW